ncbi:aminotransferase-like domain-containing protein [Pedobacter nutrimenti]|uniref:GntR family transcriptional regulator n=1 Tax=Pedobacter nutrimenti TaxID=1241337 RepID=A0A318UAG1_9SPHI|nr:PLP-dependent aminotransferase family protein [Pedobacter nutrimenti]PYF72571.1 GntR family transcriptional regulator [Pedobacter nutrimenti]
MTIPDSQKNEYLYERIAAELEQQIQSGLLLRADKMPSIRNICTDYKVSMSTALQAYYRLESKGLIRPVSKSGYYVSYVKKFPALPSQSSPSYLMGKEDNSSLVSKVYDGISSDHMMLSLGCPSAELLPVAKLNKSTVQAIHHFRESGTGYEHIQGNTKLRRQIAKRSYVWGGRLEEDDVLTTAGCSSAMTHCLMALTKHGDSIVVESPVYFGILQLAKSFGLNVIELPSDPRTGIDLDALKAILKKGNIKLCLLISNFSNPMGGTMPVEHKKETVRLMEFYNIPLLENDMYGDLYFGTQRPVNCKAFDQSGLVLLCSSVSKTLAPGYRVGWLTPGRFAEEIRRIKFATSISSNALSQEAVAGFLEKDRYENHLRKLRTTLQANSLHYMDAIMKYFPEGTKVSQPPGGFMLWVELAPKVNTALLYEQAIKKKISIAPGKMFTLQDQYNHCMRLSYGHVWNKEVEQAIKTLGKLAG